MKRILVTGGDGFIGTYVRRELLRRGFESESMDVKRSDDLDVRKSYRVNELMQSCDGWIHLAGVLGTCELMETAIESANTNIIGLLNVMEAAKRFGKPGVNIAVGNHWMPNVYSITKFTAERFADMYRQFHGVRVNQVRPMNAYGPEQEPPQPYGSSRVRKIIPTFIMQALIDGRIEVYGDGTQVGDMVHVRDVAKELVSALVEAMNGIVHEQPIEVGCEPMTVNRVAERVADEVELLTGRRPQIVHVPMRAGEPPRSVVRARGDVTGRIPFDTGLPETVRWYAENFAEVRA